MRKLNIGVILLITLLMISLLVYAKLSDETLKEVDKLRFKHYGLSLANCDVLYHSGIEWTRDFLSIWVEGDILSIETQDGKWFIKMEKVNG